MKRKIYLRLLEFILLFIALPLLVYLEPFKMPKLLVLMGLTVVIIVMLLRDKEFDKRELYNFKGVKSFLPILLFRFFLVAGVLYFLTISLIPEMLFFLPDNIFYIWVMIMLLYPILSAYPQEIVYRSFFFSRYKEIFPNEKSRVMISALSFSMLHIIYDNPVAILLSLFGGYLFTLTYRKKKSLILASIEHALYGCLIFTFGLGLFFYEGR